jgi:hypothetical protein
MIVVTFANAPGHPFSGAITGTRKLRSRPSPWAWFEPYVEVDTFRVDWDATHFVENSRLVPIPPEIIAAREVAMAKVRLRVRRDVLLRDRVDPIVNNPLRWDTLSIEQQTVLTGYRQALLDWPATEADPLNPTEPAMPEFV